MASAKRIEKKMGAQQRSADVHRNMVKEREKIISEKGTDTQADRQKDRLTNLQIVQDFVIWRQLSRNDFTQIVGHLPQLCDEVSKAVLFVADLKTGNG